MCAIFKYIVIKRRFRIIFVREKLIYWQQKFRVTSILTFCTGPDQHGNQFEELLDQMRYLNE